MSPRVESTNNLVVQRCSNSFISKNYFNQPNIDQLITISDLPTNSVKSIKPTLRTHPSCRFFSSMKGSRREIRVTKKGGSGARKMRNLSPKDSGRNQGHLQHPSNPVRHLQQPTVSDQPKVPTVVQVRHPQQPTVPVRHPQQPTKFPTLVQPSVPTTNPCQGFPTKTPSTLRSSHSSLPTESEESEGQVLQTNTVTGRSTSNPEEGARDAGKQPRVPERFPSQGGVHRRCFGRMGVNPFRQYC